MHQVSITIEKSSFYDIFVTFLHDTSDLIHF